MGNIQEEFQEQAQEEARQKSGITSKEAAHKAKQRALPCRRCPEAFLSNTQLHNSIYMAYPNPFLDGS